MRTDDLEYRSDQAETLRWLTRGRELAVAGEPMWLPVLAGLARDDGRGASLALAQAMSRLGQAIGWVSLEDNTESRWRQRAATPPPPRTRNHSMRPGSSQRERMRYEPAESPRRRRWDAVIVDQGQQDETRGARLWQRCRAVVLVCRPEMPSLQALFARVERATRDVGRAPLNLLVQGGRADEADWMGRQFDETCRRYLGQATTYLGSIPDADSSESIPCGSLTEHGSQVRDRNVQSWNRVAERLTRSLRELGQGLTEGNPTVRRFSGSFIQTAGGGIPMEPDA